MCIRDRDSTTHTPPPRGKHRAPGRGAAQRPVPATAQAPPAGQSLQYHAVCACPTALVHVEADPEPPRVCPRVVCSPPLASRIVGNNDGAARDVGVVLGGEAARPDRGAGPRRGLSRG
eukprot:9344294-Pyramimonas_sp.AAC.1